MADLYSNVTHYTVRTLEERDPDSPALRTVFH